jgi:hypothetical protein
MTRLVERTSVTVESDSMSRKLGLLKRNFKIWSSTDIGSTLHSFSSYRKEGYHGDHNIYRAMYPQDRTPEGFV